MRQARPVLYRERLGSLGASPREAGLSEAILQVHRIAMRLIALAPRKPLLARRRNIGMERAYIRSNAGQSSLAKTERSVYGRQN